MEIEADLQLCTKRERGELGFLTSYGTINLMGSTIYSRCPIHLNPQFNCQKKMCQYFKKMCM